VEAVTRLAMVWAHCMPLSPRAAPPASGNLPNVGNLGKLMCKSGLAGQACD
jgi:hypothetical protein